MKALRLLNLLRNANATGESLPSSVRQMEAATFRAHHRTAFEYFLIVYAASLCRYSGHPFTSQKLSLIARGPDREEGRDRSSRNIEFELTVAARLRLGGIAVKDGEPDLRFPINQEMLGVAVKRVTSVRETQIREALKAAVEQIERAGTRGLIAIKLEGRLEGIPAEMDEMEALAQVDKIYDSEVLTLDRYFYQNRSVAGILITSSAERPLQALAPNGLPHVDVFLPWRFHRFYEIWDDREVVEAFFGRWQQRLQVHLLYAATAHEW